jgi:hypothetical protein
MNRKTTTSVLLFALAALLSASAAQAGIHVFELSPTDVGHMVYNHYEQATGPSTPEPYYTSNPHSTANWGENRTYSEEWEAMFVQDWRAFMNFPIAGYLTGQGKILRAQFYYGVGTFVSGGPGLPEFFSYDLWTGTYHPDLTESEWDNGGFSTSHMFGIYPESGWIPLSQTAIDRMTRWSTNWGVSIHDSSHASEDGFYGAIARRCKLRLIVEYPDIHDYAIDGKTMSNNEDMSFGEIKSLYK